MSTQETADAQQGHTKEVTIIVNGQPKVVAKLPGFANPGIATSSPCPSSRSKLPDI